MSTNIKRLIESFFDNESELEYDITIKTPKIVDLGLPSGTLWCKYNLDVLNEFETGEYYSCNDGLSSTIDNLYISTGVCKLPTYELCVELIEHTTHEWVNNFKGSGINGNIFKSKVNDSYMFIPASGYLSNNNDTTWLKNKIGIVLSSDTDTENKDYILCMAFNPADIIMNVYNLKRNTKFPIRLVLNK